MKTGSRGQFLCDECRQCVLGYHCGSCHKAFRKRAESRSRIKGHQRREARRAGAS